MGKSNVFSTILLCITALLIAGVVMFKDKIFDNEQSAGYPQTSVKIQNMTVEDRLTERNTEIEINRCYDVYYSLPPVVLQFVLEDIGASANIPDIVYRYENNREHYLSKYFADQVKFDVPDSDKEFIERIELKTRLKNDRQREPEKLSPVSVDTAIVE